MTKTFRRGAAVSALLLAVTAGITLLHAQAPQARAGFHALTGPDATAFAVPFDMRLVAREPGNPPAWSRPSGTVNSWAMPKCWVASISVYTDNSGVRTAVIGTHYPNSGRPAPFAWARPGAGGRRGTPAGPDRRVAHRPDDPPDTARYFYRVELRATDSRWFTWVDAETGAVLNEYDGFTTGTGMGVKATPRTSPA